MTLHQSNVNFRKLIQDLADMYSFPVPEVVVAELVANSLDARASRISISFDPVDRVLCVEDNGTGMNSRQFAEYHDFAAELKTRGAGIGFAGLGAKISFNVAFQVITETRSSGFAGGSNWFLESPKELVWEDRKASKLRSHGTSVEVHFNKDADITYKSTDDLVAVLFRHYLPLFEERFLQFYHALKHYPKDLTFTVNGKRIKPFKLEEMYKLESSKRFFLDSKGKRYGFGSFGITPEEFFLGEEAVGVGICVYGKVVQFDFLNQFPGDISPRIFGLVEVPPLIEYLNTSKSAFIRNRATAAKFRRYYDPIREEFKRWLLDIGIKPVEAISSDEAIKLEQEIKKLVDELPELFQLFGSYTKGKANVKDPNGTIFVSPVDGVEVTFPVGEGEKGEEVSITIPGEEEGESFDEDKEGSQRAEPISRTRRAGIRISFSDSPERNELAWLDGNIVIVNVGHPSYRKSRNSNQARKLHNVFSIAVCLDKELKEQGLLDEGDRFVDRMMFAWGKIS